jgi:hypothetical protein
MAREITRVFASLVAVFALTLVTLLSAGLSRSCSVLPARMSPAAFLGVILTALTRTTCWMDSRPSMHAT